MTPERRAELLAILDEMKADLVSDAEALEGAPFDGRTVARALGNLGGTLHALATAVQVILRESDSPS